MKKYFIPIFAMCFVSLNISCASQNARKPQSSSDLTLEMVAYDTKTPLVNSVRLRVGIFQESKSTKLKGCILYLEGLADSILNHQPLFEKLSNSGYKIITFDYMGQGGLGRIYESHSALRSIISRIGNRKPSKIYLE